MLDSTARLEAYVSTVEAPLFDDTRKALRFALNAAHVQMPRPAMNVAMVEGLRKRMKPKRRRNKSEALALMQMEALGAEQEALETAQALFRRPQATLTSMERAIQAGFILQVFSHMDLTHQTLIRGQLLQPAIPCDCHRPCCSGWATSYSWSKAVEDTCTLMRQDIDTKGSISTLPKLRRAIVMAWYRRQAVKLQDLARIAECTSVTAAKHRAAIIEWLESTENNAWIEADAILGNAGIVGTFID